MKDCLIPKERVLISWNYKQGNFPVCEVLVIENQWDIQPGWRAPPEYENAAMTMGCCLSDWLNGNPQFTPEGVFSSFLMDGGFLSPAEAMRAVEQFAKIRECQWAREMLEQMKSILQRSEID